jgi:hypothetical protein
MPKSPARDDLFVVFPDLPWYRRRSAAEQVDKVRRQVKQTQLRARENIKRQRAATERVRAAIANRAVPRRRHQ